MARLCKGEKQQISQSIHRLLRRHNNGLWEQEVAQFTQMDRRRVNNYLRELERNKKAYRDGRTWFAE